MQEKNKIQNYNISIEGMTCASCLGRVDGFLREYDGVIEAEVSLPHKRAVVKAGVDFPIQKLAADLSKKGYKAKVLKDIEDLLVLESKNKSEWVLYLCLVLAAPFIIEMLFMLFSLPMFLPPLVQFSLALPVQVLGGAGFYRGAYYALRDKAANMDVLVAMATSAAFLFSLWNLWHGVPHLYFESSALVIAFVLLGNRLESRARNATGSALHALVKLRPQKALLILKNGDDEEIAAENLRKGDIVRVKAGMCIPADGIIKKGTAQIDLSMFSGESLPVLRIVGEEVSGGGVNIDGLLEIEVTMPLAMSRISQVIEAVMEAQSSKANIQRIADKVSGWFAWGVMLVALVTFLAWFLVSGIVGKSLIAAVAVLVVACPCALGLATPAVIAVAMGQLAKNGILVRNAEVLERLASITDVVFDKTGTLTPHRPEIQSILPADNIDKIEFTKILVQLQKGSDHPIAKAVEAYAKENGGFDGVPPSNLRILPAMGVEAVIGSKRYACGNEKILELYGLTLPDDLLESKGFKGQKSAIYLIEIGADITYLGMVILGEEPRPDALGLIEFLKSKGKKCHILSGDSKIAVEDMAKSLAIDDYKWRMTPEGKKEYLDLLQKSGKKVLMIGDGVNDGPILAAADVGVSMATASDLAHGAADISLMKDDLSLLQNLFYYADKTKQKIWQNLFWAFAFNLIMIPLAAFGILPPPLAAGLMVTSSLIVLSNALLLGFSAMRVIPAIIRP